MKGPATQVDERLRAGDKMGRPKTTPPGRSRAGSFFWPNANVR